MNSLTYIFKVGGSKSATLSVEAHDYAAAIRKIEEQIRSCAGGASGERSIVLRDVIIPDRIRIPG